MPTELGKRIYLSIDHFSKKQENIRNNQSKISNSVSEILKNHSRNNE